LEALVAIINEVRLSVSRTVNLGNYESAKVEAGITIVREESSDTPEDMEETAIQEIRVFLGSAIKEFLPEKK
jgi:hypothetical protein